MLWMRRRHRRLAVAGHALPSRIGIDLAGG